MKAAGTTKVKRIRRGLGKTWVDCCEA